MNSDENMLSVIYHENDYYIYQGKSMKGEDLIIKGVNYGWTVLKSVYDHKLGKEI